MIDMLKRHEIQVLRRAGHAQVEVAKLAGVSLGSVRRVAREPEVTQIDNTQERARRDIGRPAKAEPFGAWSCRDADAGTRAPLGRDLEAREARGYTRPEDGALRSRQRPASDHGPSARAVRGSSGRILATRLRRSRCPLSRWRPEAGAFLRLAVEVLALGGSRRRAGRTPRRRSSARWWTTSSPSAGFPLLAGVRSAEDGRLKMGERRPGDRMESDLRGRRARSQCGDRSLLALAPRTERNPSKISSAGSKGILFSNSGVSSMMPICSPSSRSGGPEVNTQRPCRATGLIPPPYGLEDERPRLRAVKSRPDQLALRVPVVVGPRRPWCTDTASLLDAARRDRDLGRR